MPQKTYAAFAATLLVAGGICPGASCTHPKKKAFALQATFMQYACGDEADDMRVKSVSDTSYAFLVGQDIDPYLNAETANLKDYFNNNKTGENGTTFSLKGYLDPSPSFGCDDSAPRFYVEEIARPDGKNKMTKNDF